MSVSNKIPSVFLRDSLFENKYQEGILSEKIFCLRRYFGGRYFGGRYFDREDILAEGILSEKVFRRRRYFVLEGIMSGYLTKAPELANFCLSSLKMTNFGAFIMW